MTTYTPEVKAQVIAAYQSGEAKKAISRRLGVPLTTVRQWLAQIAPVAAPENKSWLDEQVWGLIADTINGLRAIARQAQDPGWLQQQHAHDLGVFAGVQSDKLVRILGALDYSANTDAGRIEEGEPLSG